MKVFRLVPEDLLVNVCLHGIMELYQYICRTYPFAFFSGLMEAMKRRNKSIRRTRKYNSTSRPNLKKRPLVQQLKKNGGARGFKERII